MALLGLLLELAISRVMDKALNPNTLQYKYFSSPIGPSAPGYWRLLRYARHLPPPPSRPGKTSLSRTRVGHGRGSA